MKKYNISVNGISGLIAQVDSVITLDSWFESGDERTYIIKFSDYCKYMRMHERVGYDCSEFDNINSLIERICSDNINISVQDANKIFMVGYKCFLHDIGMMLLKDAALYSKQDVDWRYFDIRISLPEKVKEYFSYSVIDNYQQALNRLDFVELQHMDYTDVLISDDANLTAVINRNDFSVKNLVNTIGTPLEHLTAEGITYLKMSADNIKGRIGGVLY